MAMEICSVMQGTPAIPLAVCGLKSNEDFRTSAFLLQTRMTALSPVCLYTLI
jgi:hypothetical protein